MSGILAVFLPLLGSILAGFGNKKTGDLFAQWVTTTCMVLAFALSFGLFFGLIQVPEKIILWQWMHIKTFDVHWTLKLDQLSLTMLFVVNSVSCLVHIYSMGYMKGDPSIPRFFSYLSLFTFFMLMLVTADNLVQLFFGWEGVGLASYLLIGFWHHKHSASNASIKAFLVNRVGDFGFALGIFMVFFLSGHVGFDGIFAAAEGLSSQSISIVGYEVHALTCACLLLFVGAMGKSAQLGLHTWLPDAMEGPTPVSALIHAATMVTAGVFMLVRMSPLFEYAPIALDVVCVVGAVTALFAAVVGMTQFDIKRVIAYSTCSQLGYMFFAIGVSAYQAAMFHLFTHAFFKALLFLGAGSVIHAFSNQQDMREMGDSWHAMKITYVCMWIGSLALAGLPFFAGFYSKDIILESVFAAHSSVGLFAFICGIIAACLTAFYSWRLLFMVFHGKSRADEHVQAHLHESPFVMLLPLLILSIGALFAGYWGYHAFIEAPLLPLGSVVADSAAGIGSAVAASADPSFWGSSIFVHDNHQALAHAHHVPLWVKLLPLVVSVIGITLAFIFYIKKTDLPGKITTKLGSLYQAAYNKFYFDEVYERVFVNNAFVSGFFFWKSVDMSIIDKGGPNGVAGLFRKMHKQLSEAQTGRIYDYFSQILLYAVLLVMMTLLFILIS